MNQPAITAGAGAYNRQLSGFTGHDAVAPGAAVPSQTAGAAVPMVPQSGGLMSMDPNMMAQFSEAYKKMTKEQREQLLGDLSRDYEGEGVAIVRQEQLADELRGKEPGMRDAGAFKIAASPLEFLGKVGGDYMSKKRSDEAAANRGGLGASKSRGIQGLWSSLLRGGGGGGGGGGGYGPEA